MLRGADDAHADEQQRTGEAQQGERGLEREGAHERPTPASPTGRGVRYSSTDRFPCTHSAMVITRNGSSRAEVTVIARR